MHWYQTLFMDSLTKFLDKIQELKNEGYRLIEVKTNKKILFDGKNTIEPQVSVAAELECGTATYTVIYVI